MRICFFGAYDRLRPRNANFIKAARGSGADIYECYYDIWGGIEDKSRVKRLSTIVRIMGRRLWSCAALARKFFALPGPDVIVVGYLGHLDVWLAAFLGIFSRSRIVLLMHLSLYDTIVNDRRLVRSNSPIAWATYCVDWAAVRMADVVIADTQADVRYFSKLFKADIGKFVPVMIGVDESAFYPGRGNERKAYPMSADGRVKVLFYGQFIPLQGTEYIVRAAEQLRAESGIVFMIVGKGQEHERVRSLAESKGLSNIIWRDWVDYPDLPALIGESDMVLGIFGGTDKAGRVIPNKVFQALACRKAVITADTDGIRELLVHGRSAYLCRVADGASLAEAVLKLAHDAALREALAGAGYDVFTEKCSSGAIGRSILDITGALKPR